MTKNRKKGPDPAASNEEVRVQDVDKGPLEGEPAQPIHQIVLLAPESSVGASDDRGSFAAYKRDARNWITLITGEYYPDVLTDAVRLYGPVVELFGDLLRKSESSERLFLNIGDVPTQWMRVQLSRVFRKYASPETPVEMLKIKRNVAKIVSEFGSTFRPIHEVQAAFSTRPLPDEAICALLWEYKDRGKKGYDLTKRFFDLFGAEYPALRVQGPSGAGPDIRLGDILPEYPNSNRPVDFVIRDGENILGIGLARYDGDRGGAQEDDRGRDGVSPEILISLIGAFG